MEPLKEKLEYESDTENGDGLKSESRTTILIKAVEEEGAATTTVQGT